MEKFDQEVLEAIRVTGQIYNREMTHAAALLFLADLDGYEKNQVVYALRKCRQELRTFPTVADVISRIPDGRPGADEAWAMIPKDEDSSYVWTEEMAEAYGVCRELMESDPIAARMAFREVYTKLVTEAKAQKKIARWSPSLGLSASGREEAIQEADARNLKIKNLLGQDQTALLLPEPEIDSNNVEGVKKMINQSLRPLP